VPARFRASVPIIPTHVLDRSLHDANQITYLVICRKVVFSFPHRHPEPTIVILNLFQDNTPTSPVILNQVQDDEFCEFIRIQVQGDEVGGGSLTQARIP
jgi:hypothetical protein